MEEAEWMRSKDQRGKIFLKSVFSRAHCCHSVSLSSWFEMAEEAATRISLQKWLLTAQPCHCPHPLYDPIPPYYQGVGSQTSEHCAHDKTWVASIRTTSPISLPTTRPKSIWPISASDIVCFDIFSQDFSTSYGIYNFWPSLNKHWWLPCWVGHFWNVFRRRSG